MTEKQKNPESEARSGNLKRWLLMGAAAIVLLGGGTAAGYFLATGLVQKPAAAAPTAEDQERAASGKNEAVSPEDLGPMIDIESFIVNILDEQGTRYLKAAITLEADNAETAEEVNERLPQVRDAILLLVGNKTFRELSDLQGKLQLRADLMARLNEILQAGEIKRIYFTQFVVQ